MANRHLRDLELTIISAESLSLTGNHRLKKNPFVVIKIDSTADQTTTMDSNTSNPTWNQKFFITIPMNVRFFTLEVRCRKKFSGEHVVGSARVPTSDFDGVYFPMNYLHFLSYRLRDRNGELNGIINLSIKINNGQRISISGVAVGVPFHHRY